MLLYQTRTFDLQLRNFLIDVVDFLLNIIVMLAQNFLRFTDVRRRWRCAFNGRLAVSFMEIPVIKPITAMTIK